MCAQYTLYERQSNNVNAHWNGKIIKNWVNSRHFVLNGMKWSEIQDLRSVSTAIFNLHLNCSGSAEHDAINGLIVSSSSFVVTRQTTLIPISIVLGNIIQLTFLPPPPPPKPLIQTVTCVLIGKCILKNIHFIVSDCKFPQRLIY